MSLKFKHKTHTKRAFAFIELIITISVMCLLIAIAVAFLSNEKARGSDTIRIRSLNEVRTALNIYFNDSSIGGGNGTYPIGNLPDLKAKLETKYIKLVNSNIIYSGATSTYHLAIVLMNNNKVLVGDSDLNDGIIDGRGNNCSSYIEGDIELCYDVTP